MVIKLNGHCFITDNEILWVRLPREGDPDLWEPGKNYGIGDLVKPSSTANGLDQVMFQCVGFLGKSDSSEPTFDKNPGETTIDGNVEWATRDRNQSRPRLQEDQYFLIDENVTAQ